MNGNVRDGPGGREQERGDLIRKRRERADDIGRVSADFAAVDSRSISL